MKIIQNNYCQSFEMTLSLTVCFFFINTLAHYQMMIMLLDMEI